MMSLPVPWFELLQDLPLNMRWEELLVSAFQQKLQIQFSFHEPLLSSLVSYCSFMSDWVGGSECVPHSFGGRNLDDVQKKT